MGLSQKCSYAIRAVFELARRGEGSLVKSGDIAERHGIPSRFLEAILVQLKQGGFVVSRRGADGGYSLARPARLLTLGDVIRFVDGPTAPVETAGVEADSLDRLLFPVWRRAEDALAAVYDATTFEDLVQQERAAEVVDFAI